MASGSSFFIPSDRIILEFEADKLLHESQYLKIYLMRHKRTKETFIVRERIVTSEAQFKSISAQVKKFGDVSHYALRNFRYYSHELLVAKSHSWKFYFWFEYFPTTLAETLADRKQKGGIFLEGDLLAMMKNLLSVFTFLEMVGLNYGAIEPRNIMMRDMTVKFDPCFIRELTIGGEETKEESTSLKAADKPKVKQRSNRNLGISPSEERKEDERDQGRQKDVVYQLGCIFLEMATLSECKNLTEADVRAMIKIVSTNYSIPLAELLGRMVALDPSKRDVIPNLYFSIKQMMMAPKPASKNFLHSDMYPVYISSTNVIYEPNPKPPIKIIPSFEDGTKTLILVNVTDARHIFVEKVDLNIDFQLPFNSQGLFTRECETFLVSGEDSPNIYVYDSDKNTLVKKATLPFAVSFHAVCETNDKVYIVGGMAQGEKAVRECFSLDKRTGAVEEIAPLNFPTHSHSLCTLNDRFIFKIGGEALGSASEGIIEKYDIAQDIWFVLDFSYDVDLSARFLLRNPITIELNQYQVLVLGGFDKNDAYFDHSLVICCDSGKFPPTESKTDNCHYDIRNLNQHRVREKVEYFRPLFVRSKDCVYWVTGVEDDSRRLLSLTAEENPNFEWKEVKKLHWL
eukprot:TRINITY_DN777_c0_g1_i2.p1 TRINITY_DN777_c0_g1~~TRINITY_DN777_c0_g1_i2.p1  ORF type:complete len:627 (-),score=140.91 TRINITY_DN777_c0_g1_i2:124-2004(-)